MNRAINYIEAISDLFGMKPSRVQTIDKAMAASGLRRKGSGRTAPMPTIEEEIALIVAINSAASPPSWLAARKEPTIRDAADEAKHWLALPCLPPVGSVAPRFARSTLGECLVAFVKDFPWDQEEMAKSLRLGLNLTTDEAFISFTATNGDHEFLHFTDRGKRKPVDAETVTTIMGRALARISAAHR